MLRFGTDGVRGVALTELTPSFVTALGSAAARVLDGRTWLVGRDPRESGPILEDALVAGLVAEGAEVLLCGVVPTPALARLSAEMSMPAAMITASHNPYTDNGVKIFASGGLKLTDDVEQKIEALLSEHGDSRGAGEHRAPDPRRLDDVVDRYVDALVGLFEPGVLGGLKVVLDCANGSMSVAAGLAVSALGAEVVVINAEPTGANINASCGATHPGSLVAAVIEHGADAGLAFDGDGDRVIAVDDRGQIVDGDRLIALGALQLREDGQLTRDTVVVTVMSNIGFHHAMRDAGIDVVATAVGDRYVLEALEAGDFAIGGEQSGHIIYRHLATTGDGLLAGIQLLHRVNGSARTLAAIADGVMTTYPQVLVNIRVRERHPDIAAELAAEITAAEAALGGDGRVLVRASGTEPLVRVMVEAVTDALAAQVAEQLADVVRARFAS